jgi:hypothetical protein
MIQRHRTGREPPSPRAMLLRALVLLGVLIVLVLSQQRAAQGGANCLAFFGQG